jgi:hypothetical protein
LQDFNGEKLRKLFKVLVETMTRKYVTTLPSPDMLYSIYYVDEVRLNSDETRRAIINSFITTSVTFFKEEDDSVVAQSSIMRLLAAAVGKQQRNGASEYDRQLVCAYNVMVKQIEMCADRPERFGYLLEEVAFQWLLLRLTIAGEVWQKPTSLAKLLGFSRASSLRTILDKSLFDRKDTESPLFSRHHARGEHG